MLAIPWKKIGILLLLIFGIAFSLRSLNYSSVFHDGRVHFRDTDSWYHMRRIHYAADHNFQLPEPDPLLNYPEGSLSYWGPLFDWLGASLIKLSGTTTKTEREKIIAWVPAILGAFCIFPAFFLSGFLIRKGQRFDYRSGLIGSLALAVLPGHGVRSLLGDPDHHAMESLLFGISAALFCALRMANTKKMIRLTAILCAISLVLIYFLHPAVSNLYILIFWAAILCHLWQSKEKRLWWAPFILSGIFLLGPAYLNLDQPDPGLASESIGRIPTYLLFNRLSFLQPGILLFCGLIILALESKGYLRKTALALAFLFAAGLSLPIFEAIPILLLSNPFLRYTAESQPILMPLGYLSFGSAIFFYGWLFVVFPLWWIALLKDKEKDFFLIALIQFLFLLILLQQRYTYVFSYAATLAIAWFFIWLWRKINWTRTLRLFVSVLFLASFFPSFQWWFRLTKAEPTTSPSIYTLMDWIKNNTEDPGGFNDIRQTPDWGIMARWDMGHHIAYLAERPVVSDPFHHGMKESYEYYSSTSPHQAIEILKRKKVKYIVPWNSMDLSVLSMLGMSLNLPNQHPVWDGAWEKLFHMRIILNLPVPGPDNKPSKWGHSLVKSPSGESINLIEFDPSHLPERGIEIKNTGTPLKEKKAYAKIGTQWITENDLLYSKDILSCSIPKKEIEKLIFLHSTENAIQREIMSCLKGKLKNWDGLLEEKKILETPGIKRILRCLRNGKSDYSELKSRHIEYLLNSKFINTYVRIKEFKERLTAYHSLQKVATIPYEIYDTKYQDWFYQQKSPLFSSLYNDSKKKESLWCAD